MNDSLLNRRWLVIPSSIVDQIDFNQVLESSVDSLRYSVDRSKVLIKYDIVEVPEDFTVTAIIGETGETELKTTLAGIYGRPLIYSNEYIEYKHAEILELLNTSEWSNFDVLNIVTPQ